MGDKRHPSWENLQRMSLARNCVKESMRIHNPVGVNLRILQKDAVLQGYQVPAGVLTLFYVSLLLEKELNRQVCLWPPTCLPKMRRCLKLHKSLDQTGGREEIQKRYTHFPFFHLDLDQEHALVRAMQLYATSIWWFLCRSEAGWAGVVHFSGKITAQVSSSHKREGDENENWNLSGT